MQLGETQTRRVTVSHSAPANPVSPQETVTPPTSPLEILAQLSPQGPPQSYEDRIARQLLANGQSLPPEVYNFLCFGEGIVQPAPQLSVTAPTPSENPDTAPFRAPSKGKK